MNARGRRVFKQALWLACAAGLSLPNARAQTPQSGFSFTAPLSLSAGRDRNFLVGRTSVDDNVAVLSAPEFTLSKFTSRTEFSLKYQPEFEIFEHNRDLDAWNHSAGLTLTHRLSPRLSFTAGDTFIGTQDPARRLADSFFRLPRGDFKENFASAGISYALSSVTSIDLRFDNSVTTFDLPQANLFGIFDHMSNAPSIGISRSFGRHHRIGTSYSYLMIRPLDSRTRVLQAEFLEPSHYWNWSYRYTSADWVVDLFGSGILRSRLGYSAAGQIERRAGPIWLSGGYQRYASFLEVFRPGLGGGFADPRLVNGVLPSSLYQAASAGVRGRFGRRFGFDAKGLRSINALTIGNRNVKSVLGRLRLDYRLTERLTVFATAEYYGQNLNEVVEVPLKRERLFGGIEISLSRPRSIEDRGASRGRGEAERGTSTDHPED